MRNVDPEEAEERGEQGSHRIHQRAGEQNRKQQQQCARAAVMLRDPGRKGTEGPSALSYERDFERTGEELDDRRTPEVALIG